MTNISKQSVFIALLIAVCLLVLSLGCVFMVKSQTAYADYQDLIDDPNAVVNFNQLIKNDYVNYSSNMISMSNINITNDYSMQYNNIYYIRYNAQLSSDRAVEINITDYSLGNVDTKTLNSSNNHYEFLFTSTNNCKIRAYTNGSDTKLNCMCINVSLMFGVGNEPNLQECQQLFIANAYAYNTGTAMSLNGLNSYNDGYNAGVSDTYNSFQLDTLNYGAYSSCYLLTSMSPTPELVKSVVDGDYDIKFRGYLAVPLNNVIPSGSLVQFSVVDPGMGGAGGDHLWVGILYNNEFIPCGCFDYDVEHSFVTPYSTDTIVFSVSSSDTDFVFFDVAKWMGDFKVYGSKIDIDTLIQASVDSAVNERDEYYHNYYGQYGNGYQTIYNSGYQTGLNAQLNEAGRHFYTFPQFLGALFDVPVKTITSLLDFEVLGFNLKNFFFSLITLSIIFALIKFILVRTGDK